MIPWGIETATFRLVAQCLKKMRYCVPNIIHTLIKYGIKASSVTMRFNIKIQMGTT
jgi:hypothetical protein